MKALILIVSFFACAMAMACPSGNLCKGDRVLDLSHNIGTVLDVFSNGKVQVSLDGSYGSVTRHVSELGKGVRCSQNICASDRVVDRSNNVGEAVEVFDNGKVKIEFDSSYGFAVRSINELGKGRRCVKHFCKGDRVIDASNKTGEALEIFDNGKVKIEFDSSYGFAVRSINELGKGYRCIENLCKGDRVIDASNKTGEALEIFDNGKVKIEFDSSYGFAVRSFQDLGIELNCRLRDNCSCRN